MKNMLAAVISMVVIIAGRMILSLTFGEQAAEVFSRITVGFLFYYFICRLLTSKRKGFN